MRKDTRRVFDEFTTCKPADWAEVEAVRVTEIMREALVDKPVIEIKLEQSPFYQDERFNRETNNGHIEFLVRRGGDFYYVNTEGFDYARYIARLVGF